MGKFSRDLRGICVMYWFLSQIQILSTIFRVTGRCLRS